MPARDRRIPLLEDRQSEVRRVEPSRRVQARPDAESDVFGPGGFPGQAGLFEKRPKSRRPGIGEPGEAFGDDPAVLPEKGNDVADRAERGDLRERRLGERQLLPANDRLGDLEGDAGPAEVLEGVSAARLFRVDHGSSLRQDVGGQVMVGDDDGDARFRRLGDRLDGSDPAIHRDDRLRPVLLEHPPKRLGLEAVAVAHAVRKKRHGVGAEHPEHGPELRDRGHAVDVVVSENDDPSRGSSRPRTRTSTARLHSLHPERVVTLSERRREEIPRRHGRRERPGRGRRDAETEETPAPRARAAQAS